MFVVPSGDRESKRLRDEPRDCAKSTLDVEKDNNSMVWTGDGGDAPAERTTLCILYGFFCRASEARRKLPVSKQTWLLSWPSAIQLSPLWL